jgi:hypothetical protein
MVHSREIHRTAQEPEVASNATSEGYEAFSFYDVVVMPAGTSVHMYVPWSSYCRAQSQLFSTITVGVKLMVGQKKKTHISLIQKHYL